MNPVNFEDMNCIFKAEGCGDLPALKTDKHIVSCWEMTEKEKEDMPLVYDEFCPTENYMWCNGRKFIER